MARSQHDLVVALNALEAQARKILSELSRVVYQADVTRPSTPTGLSVSPISENAANLSWEAALDVAGPPSELVSGVAGYRVYRNGVLRTTVATLTFQDTGLSAYTLYDWTVSAIDAANNESAQSAALQARTLDTTAPSAPVITATQTGLTSISVALTSPSTDAGSGVATYALEYKRTADSTWTVDGAALTAGQFPRSITGLTAGTQYDTRCRATDASSNVGNYSATSQATTASSGATNRYVRQGATGSGTGLDWTNAYTALPSTLLRAATYYIAAGTYPGYTFDDAASSTSLITIKKATATDHGTETGWVSSYGTGRAQFGQSSFTTPYWLIDGQARNASNWRDTDAYGIRFQGTGGKVITMASAANISNITFQYVDFAGAGRDTGNGDDIFYLNPAPGISDSVTIRRCALHDTDRTLLLTWPANVTNWLLEENYAARNASDPVTHGEAWSFGAGNTVTVRYNVFEDIEGSAVLAGLNIGTMTNMRVYGNVATWTDAYLADTGRGTHNFGVSGFIWVINDAGNTNTSVGMRVYNNTIHRAPGTHSGVKIQAGSDNEARNNLWWGCVATGHTGVTLSHNTYCDMSGAISDASGQTLAGGTDPFVDENAANFHLTSAGAAAITAGTTLASPYTTDMDGATRDSDGKWDRGAFEFVSTFDPATTRYIRQGATGNGSGTDWTNAFASMPATMQRGFTYYVAAGAYGTYDFNDAASGTTLITLKKATVADHGTDTGWSSAYAAVATFGAWTWSTSHWLCDGVVGGGPGSWNSGFGFEVFSNSSFPTSSATGVTNITCRHTKIYSDRLAHTATFKNVTGFSNHTFSYCMLAEVYDPLFHIGGANGLVIEYSYLNRNRSDGAWHSEGISTVNTNTNVTIRWCLWDQVEGTSVFAGINSGTDSAWRIYGNIFSRCPTSIMQYIDDATNNASMNNCILANNTVVDCGQSSQGGFTVNTGGSNQAINTLFYQNDHNQFAKQNVTHSYSYASKNIRSDGGPFDKDAEILSGDANGQNGADANPFVGYNANPLLANYDATTNSGFNTNSLIPENAVDMLGNARGAGGVWTRGAIQ